MASADHQCSNFEEIEALVGGQGDSYLSTAYKCVECGSLFLPESDTAGEQSIEQAPPNTQFAELPDEQTQQLEQLLQKQTDQGDSTQDFTSLAYSSAGPVDLPGSVTQQSLQNVLLNESRGNNVSLLQNNTLLVNNDVETIAQLTGQATLKQEPLDLADVKLEHQADQIDAPSFESVQQHGSHQNISIENSLSAMKSEVQNLEQGQDGNIQGNPDACIFLCEICSTPTESKEAFVEHMISVHNSIVPEEEDTEISTCGTCGAKFKSQSEILQHVGDNHPLPNDSSGQIYKCSSCSTYFTTEDSLYAHSCPGETEMDDNNLDPEGEPEPTSTVHFVEDNDQEQGVIIQTAQYKDGTVKYYDVKYKKVFLTDGKMLCQCKECHYTTGDSKALIEHHRSVHTQSQDYVCEVCNETFTWKPLYDTHVERRHPDMGVDEGVEYTGKGRPPKGSYITTQDQIKVKRPYVKTYKTHEETTKALYNNSICEFCFWKCKSRVELHEHVLKKHKQGSLTLMEKWLNDMRRMQNNLHYVSSGVDEPQEQELSVTYASSSRKVVTDKQLYTSTRIKTSPYCPVGRPRKRMVNRNAGYVDPDTQLIALAESDIDVNVEFTTVKRRTYYDLPQHFSSQFSVQDYKVQVGLPNGVCDVFYSIDSLGMREALVVRPEKPVDFEYILVEPPLNEKEIVCETCRKIYRPSISYNPGLLFVCKLCVSSKVFVEENHLACHLDHAHPFQMNKARCPLCEDRIFNAQEEFYAHLRRYHSSGGTSHCYLCSLVNYRSSNLSLHIDRHLQMRGDGVQNCPICDQQFNSANVLNTHVVKFHPSAMKVYDELYSGKYRCGPCNQSYRFEGSLHMHRSVGSCIATLDDENIQVDMGEQSAQGLEEYKENDNAVQMIIDQEGTENEVDESGGLQIELGEQNEPIPKNNVMDNGENNEDQRLEMLETQDNDETCAEMMQSGDKIIEQTQQHDTIEVDDPEILKALQEGKELVLNPESGKLELPSRKKTNTEGSMVIGQSEATRVNETQQSEGKTRVNLIQTTAIGDNSRSQENVNQDVESENTESISENIEKDLMENADSMTAESVVLISKSTENVINEISVIPSADHVDTTSEGTESIPTTENVESVSECTDNVIDDTVAIPTDENVESISNSPENVIDNITVIPAAKNVESISESAENVVGDIVATPAAESAEPVSKNTENIIDDTVAIPATESVETVFESTENVLGDTVETPAAESVEPVSEITENVLGDTAAIPTAENVESVSERTGVLLTGDSVESVSENTGNDIEKTVDIPRAENVESISESAESVIKEFAAICSTDAEPMPENIIDDIAVIPTAEYVEGESHGVQLVGGDLVIPTNIVSGEAPPTVTIEVLDQPNEGEQMMEVEGGQEYVTAPESMDTQ